MNLKLGNAPRADGISSEIFKILIQTTLDIWLRLYTNSNICLEGSLSKQIEEAEAGVSKERGQSYSLDMTSSNRPICFLDIAGKILEDLIFQRINTHIRENLYLSQTYMVSRKPTAMLLRKQ